MSCMPDMTPTPLAAAVAPCTSKIIKKFLKEEKICYKMVYYTHSIVRNCVGKLKFKKTKNRFF